LTVLVLEDAGIAPGAEFALQTRLASLFPSASLGSPFVALPAALTPPFVQLDLYAMSVRRLGVNLGPQIPTQQRVLPRDDVKDSSHGSTRA
jgi:hypothetical protein